MKIILHRGTSREKAETVAMGLNMIKANNGRIPFPGGQHKISILDITINELQHAQLNNIEYEVEVDGVLV